VVKSKVYVATKVSPFIANYGSELRMEVNIRRKESRENNRVCEKDKEGVEKSRSSTEKNNVGH